MLLNEFAFFYNVYYFKKVQILRRIKSLFWFYGILTIIGYLMPNSLYTYILNV